MDNNEKLWNSRVAQFRNSGMSLGGWCREHGCKRNQMKYWLSRVPEQEQVTWTEVIAADTTESDRLYSEIKVRYNGFEITLPVSELNNLIRAVSTNA